MNGAVAVAVDEDVIRWGRREIVEPIAFEDPAAIAATGMQLNGGRYFGAREGAALATVWTVERMESDGPGVRLALNGVGKNGGSHVVREGFGYAHAVSSRHTCARPTHKEKTIFLEMKGHLQRVGGGAERENANIRAMGGEVVEYLLSEQEWQVERGACRV